MASNPDKVRAELVAVPEAARMQGPGPHALSVEGVDLVLLRGPGGPRVFQGRCPHQGALLAEGELAQGTLVCRNHGWQFDAETGRRQGGPQCLVACPAFEVDGQLRIDLSPLSIERGRISGMRAVAPGARRIDDLPGPKGLPLIGNVHQLDLSRLHDVAERWAAEYGSLYVIRVGKQPTVVVSDPALTQQVLRARPETFERPAKLQRVFQELGVDGVFSAGGKAWRPQRQLAMQALAQRHLGAFYPTLRAVAERLRRRWQRAADEDTIVDVAEDLKRFTVDVTTSLTFGQDTNTIEQAGDDLLQRRLELLFPAFNRRIFATVPWWRWLRMPSDRRLDRALAEVRVWLEDLVVKARARQAADPARAANPANFLEAMLLARDDAGQPFSDPLIFANLMTMLLAGEDTTAYSLAWAVHELCDSPASVVELQAELDRLTGGEIPAELESANRLAYAGAVASETMRLRPVAPVILLESIVDTAIGDLELPAHTHVLLLTRPPAVEERHFHEPALFRPGRWIEAGPGPHEPSANIPFGSGPRICPGRSLALLEMKVALAMIYGTFEITRVGERAAVREHFAFTMPPEGLRVRLRRRARPSAA